MRQFYTSSIKKKLPVTKVFVANPHIASTNSLDYPSFPNKLALLRISISFYDIASPLELRIFLEQL